MEFRSYRIVDGEVTEEEVRVVPSHDSASGPAGEAATGADPAAG